MFGRVFGGADEAKPTRTPPSKAPPPPIEGTGISVVVPQKPKATPTPPPEAEAAAAKPNDLGGVLFSGLDVKPAAMPASAEAPAAPPASLLSQGGDLMEDVQLELPGRNRGAPAPVASLMDLDATVDAPAAAPVGEDGKKGKKSSSSSSSKEKKKHKKDHKSSSKSSSSHSSGSISAAKASPADAKPVRKRVVRSNVTRPGYGREEDRPVDAADEEPEPAPEPAPASVAAPAASPATGSTAPAASAYESSLSSVFAGMSLAASAAVDAPPPDDSSQAGILSGMVLKVEDTPVDRSPAPIKQATASNTTTWSASDVDVIEAAPMVLDEDVVIVEKPQQKPTPPVSVERAPKPAAPAPNPAPATPVEPPVAARESPKKEVKTAPKAATPPPPVAQTPSPAPVHIAPVEGILLDTSPTVTATTPKKGTVSQQSADALASVFSATNDDGTARAAVKPVRQPSSAPRKSPAPVVRQNDARAAEKEMRELMDELESALATAGREAEHERLACVGLLREKAALMRELQALQGSMRTLRERVAECEQGEKYDEAAAIDADMQSAAVKAAAKERRARELEEEVETKARQVAVLQSKEVSVRRKGLLKLIELRRRREDGTNQSTKEREEYARERESHMEQRSAQLERSHAGLESDMAMLTSNRDSIRGIVEKATGGLRVEREGLRERLGEVEREIRELERLLREKLKIKAQVAEKIAKIDTGVKDIRARYDGELGELEAALREKEMRVAELDVERGAMERARREFKDTVAAMDSRVAKQKEGLASLAIVIRRLEAEIQRGEKATAARDRDRDALRAIEASFLDETDAAREVRVRLEEYDFEIKEAQGRLDALATKLKEKRAEEEDLRLSKMVRAEQDKKQAAQDRNYKEAQRLRDAVAKMKARCSELESEIEELQVQQREHSKRVEDALKASAEERERMDALLKDRDTSRLSLVEAKVRELARMRLRRTNDMKETLASLRAAADGGGERGGRLDEAEGDRKQVTADLELLELQIEEALAECVLLADRTGQPERVVALRALLNDTAALEAASRFSPAVDAAPTSAKSVARPLSPLLAATTTPPPQRAAAVAAASPAAVGAGGASRAELVQLRAARASELAAAEAELEAALAEDNYEAAEQLDPRIERVKGELAALDEALANAPAAADDGQVAVESAAGASEDSAAVGEPEHVSAEEEGADEHQDGEEPTADDIEH